MSLSETEVRPYLVQLDRLANNAAYTAQIYYEATKRLDALARRLVFLPSCASALAAFAVALGAYRWIGGISALASVMVATASYLGVDRKASAFRRTAGQMTALRHGISLVRDLATQEESLTTLDARTRQLSEEYREIVTSAEPTSNQDYETADARIKQGVLDDRPAS